MRFKYGRRALKLTLDKLTFDLIEPRERAPLDNVEDAVLQVLRNPINSPPLRQLACGAGKVVILVNDQTRVARTDLFLPVIVRELNDAGVTDAGISVVFTNGSHRLLTAAEMESIVGAEMAQRLRLINHDASDGAAMVYCGATRRGTPVYLHREVASADLRLLTGSIVYHFFAGFGGGRKALIPGAAAHQTIQANHALMLEEGARLGVLEGNPVHEDLLEAALLAGGGFVFNVVLNEQKEILAVFGGEMQAAHRRGCQEVEKIYGSPISAPYDLVIASCGGYPKDINIYQAQKTLENAAQAVRPGGAIILLAECIEGHGSDTYLEFALRYRTLDALRGALRNNFILGGHKAYAVARVTSQCAVYLYSALDQTLAADLGFHPVADPHAAVEAALRRLGPRPRTLLLPEGSLTVPFLHR